MSDEQTNTSQPIVEPDVITDPAVVESTTALDKASEAISEPAKVMRIGAMIRQLLEEVRQSPLDEPGRDRLRNIYEQSVGELGSALSEDLREELGRLSHPFAQEGVPSGAELRVAQAQLVGWLEGLFHGIQAAVFAQQAVARQQLDQMRRPAIGAGQQPPAPDEPTDEGPSGTPGVYL